MIAVDTNILVYAFRREAPDHVRANEVLDDIRRSGDVWAICWPSVHEFLGTVTRPNRWIASSTQAKAMEAVRAWMTSPTLRLLCEAADHIDRLDRVLKDSGVVGPAVHDARIAAICLSHGVSELWTADRDFVRFPSLKSRNTPSA